MLSKKEDSTYAGSVIASWAQRYVKLPEENELKTDHQIVAQIGSEGFTTEIKAGIHSMLADEPKSIGGDNLGPTPYGYLLSALGSCTAMTMRMYADRKGWKIDHINVHLSHTKDHCEHCMDSEKPNARIDVINRKIEIVGDLTDDQRKRMMIIADKCPVHRTLHNTVGVRGGE